MVKIYTSKNRSFWPISWREAWKQIDGVVCDAFGHDMATSLSIILTSSWLYWTSKEVNPLVHFCWIKAGFLASCEAHFLWKKTRSVHVNLHSPWTQDALSLKKHMETGRVSAMHVLVERRNGIRKRLVACHMNLQSHWTQNAFYLRKHREPGGLVQRFSLEKHTSPRGWVMRGI